ncbi:MAG TPA: ATP-binding protein [Burkholderiales bacterium]|nr:ATP-binding protein [Burkholderiales bacterium]
MRSLGPIKLPVAAAYVATYVLLDWASEVFPLGLFGVTPWNPSPALSLAVLLAFGLGYAPLLFVAELVSALLVRQMVDAPSAIAAQAAVLALGYTGVAAVLLRWLRIDPLLSTQRDLTAFSVCVVIGTTVVEAAYVAVQCALGGVPWEDFLAVFQLYWLGDIVGIVVLTPALLIGFAHARGPGRRAPRLRLEPILQAALLAAVFGVLLGFKEGGGERHFYLLFLPLAWISLRSGFAGAALGALAAQIGLIFAATLAGYRTTTIVELQFFMLVLALGTQYLGMAITERQRAQDQLLEHEIVLREKQRELDRALRHAEAAEMASALVHELSQPLSAVASYLRSCELMFEAAAPDRARLADTLSRASAEVRRAGAVLKGLREFFRTGTGKLEPVAPESLIQHALGVQMSRLAREKVELQVDCSADLPEVYVDRMQVETVLQNLASNAIDAMVSAGEGVRRLRIEAARDGRQAVRLTVRDTGPGLDSEAAGKIFQPFWTTKPQGMGLGLALSRTIIESHGGRLWTEPASRGASFSLTLPVADGEVTER